MARHEVIELIDDLDGSQAEETVLFSIDGTDYAIELSTYNAAALRTDLAPYRRAGRVLSGNGYRGAQGVGEPARIRRWARANGHQVSGRGRIHADVIAAYAAAGGRNKA